MRIFVGCCGIIFVFGAGLLAGLTGPDAVRIDLNIWSWLVIAMAGAIGGLFLAMAAR
jgi:hypothetical protein